MKYGDKRDYPKIDIMVRGYYTVSTTWAENLKQAKQKYLEKHPELNEKHVVAYYA